MTRSPLIPLILLAVAVAAPAAEPPAAAPKVDYNRDVRPILADNCFKCHGPDEKQRKANLRLDTKDGFLAETTNGRAVVPGKADRSELVARTTATDAKQVMPPPRTGKKLTAEQIATLKAWIDQGAPWAGHWAFTPPVRPPVPETPNTKHRTHNTIDNFIVARLAEEGLKLAPEADKVTLIRRVTLDLTGLPPTPEEVDAFVKDTSPDAYEKLVGRLL